MQANRAAHSGPADEGADGHPAVTRFGRQNGRDLPLCLSSGEPVRQGVVVLNESMAIFEFANLDEPPVISINRGFSAPIKLITDLSVDDLAFLAAHDSDPFNRWQALQTISMRLLIDNVDALRSGRPARKYDQLMP